VSKAPRLIQSIERSASILEVIAQEGGSARLQQIAHLTGLGKTTVHNILRTLDHLGYVQRRPGDMRYHLGGRILNIARMAGDDNALRNRLHPALLAIAKESGGTVYLGVPSGDEASYLDIITPDQPPDVPRDILRRETLEGSAIGLVFLAFVPGLAKRVLARLDATEDEALFARIETVRPEWCCHSLSGKWRSPGRYCCGRACGAVSARTPDPTKLDDDAPCRTGSGSTLLKK
jgi:DNA-binding IclR family transcriptional regulator